jgi:hypothetical protein
MKIDISTLLVKHKETIWRKFVNKLTCGIKAKQAEPGINNMPKIQSVKASLIQKSKQLKKYALGAVVNILQRAKNRLIAHQHVRLQNLATEEVLEKHAQPIMQATYNLTVKTVHCYYANDLLVHNCDSTSQALIYLADKNWLSMTIIPPDSGIIPKKKPSYNPYSV